MPRRKKVDIDLHGMAKLMDAEVFAESSYFICLIPDTNVVGRGETVTDAINAWNVNLKGHLRDADENDSIVKLAKVLLSSATQERAFTSQQSHIQIFTPENFAAQFYLSKKAKK